MVIPNLYSMSETNTDETLNSEQSIKKIDILFDFEANKQTVLDAEFDKNIVCVCGSCDLVLENNGEKESLILNNHKKTVHLNKNIQAELKNYTPATKIVVEYLGDINE